MLCSLSFCRIPIAIYLEEARASDQVELINAKKLIDRGQNHIVNHQRKSQDCQSVYVYS